jgi:methyltransferase (TIGR00027 family)
MSARPDRRDTQPLAPTGGEAAIPAIPFLGMRPDRPSLTARWIAAHRARLADTRPTLPAGDADAESRLYEGLSSRLLVLPGLSPTGIKTRTSFFDRETLNALRRGLDQIVIVGAGYDGRALRFADNGVRWIEVDHPATQADKRKRLSDLGVGLDHLSFAPVDLTRDDFDAALSVVEHDPGRPTLFICEGLFAYLPIGSSRSLCETLRRRSHPDSVLAANFRVAPACGAPAGSLHRAIDGALAILGEHRRMDFRPGDAEDLLAQGGWAIVSEEGSEPNRLDGGSYLLVVTATPST